MNRARGAAFAALALAVVALGCGGKNQIPLVPVSGVVKVGGAPMPMGTVQFHPDAGRGNSFNGKPTGMIKSDGTYTLNTEGREGAPAGWYKVTVSGQGMPDPTKMAESSKVPTAPTINAKYTRPDSSGFAFEVKDGAPTGAYDLSLVK
jgi:hypothetical protein